MVTSANFVCLQGDGRSPTLLADGNAPGESGVSLLHVQFRGGAYLRATNDTHLIYLHQSEPTWVDCRMADERLFHQARLGTMGVCPAGADCVGETSADIETLIVAVKPAALALTASEDAEFAGDIIECLADEDPELLAIGQMLSRECTGGYPNGGLFWHELAGRFMDRMLAQHATVRPHGGRGTLTKEVLARLRDYIEAHLHEPIDVATLASIAGRSPFHFARVFTRSVGVTPHRYVVHLRLKRALQLMRGSDISLAAVAADTGFADQSHLSRWVRRVHGVSLRELAA